MEESLRKDIYDLPKTIKEAYGFDEQDPSQLSPLVLAYIGDTVFDLIVRLRVIEEANEPVKKLNKKATSVVNASTQAAMMRERILPNLTEEEERVFKRGRNTKSYSSSKHAKLVDYRVATGFEALLGWLYLKGRLDRITELVLPAIPDYEFKGKTEKENEI